MNNKIFVLDSNVLVSAFLSKSSVSKKAYDKARNLGRLTASGETYDEFCEVFVRRKFDPYISLDTRLEIINGMVMRFSFFKISESISACRDPKDNKFLELAVASKANCIVTGDSDLLVLHPFRTISILNPSAFLNSFE